MKDYKADTDTIKAFFWKTDDLDQDALYVDGIKNDVSQSTISPWHLPLRRVGQTVFFFLNTRVSTHVWDYTWRLLQMSSKPCSSDPITQLAFSFIYPTVKNKWN